MDMVVNPNLAAHVLLVQDPKGLRSFLLEDVVYTIGRDPRMGIVLAGDFLCPQHGMLMRETASSSDSSRPSHIYRLVDGNLRGQRSRFGLQIDGIPFLNYQLRDGDVVSLCPEVQISYYHRPLIDGCLDIGKGLRFQPQVPQGRGRALDESEFAGLEQRITPIFLILQSHEVKHCGIIEPGQTQPRFGIRYKSRCFLFEQLYPFDQQQAIQAYLSRLEYPRYPHELALFLQEEAGYRLCIHYPQLGYIPYVQLLDYICDQMRSPAVGLVADRRWKLRVYNHSFLGTEAVTWLANYLGVSRQKAEEFGEICQSKGFLAHVLDEQEFADQPHFYRFTKDGQPEKRFFSR